jgi:hypothetical protein
MCGERANAFAFREAGRSNQKRGEECVKTDVIVHSKRTEAAEVAMRAIAMGGSQNQSRQRKHSLEGHCSRQQHLRKRWLDFRLSWSCRSSRIVSTAEDPSDMTADRQRTVNRGVEWKDAAAEEKDNDRDGADTATDQPGRRNHLAHRCRLHFRSSFTITTIRSTTRRIPAIVQIHIPAIMPPIIP